MTQRNYNDASCNSWNNIRKSRKFQINVKQVYNEIRLEECARVSTETWPIYFSNKRNIKKNSSQLEILLIFFSFAYICAFFAFRNLLNGIESK